MARILRRWRQLTGGRQTRDSQRRTLVACSAGADSVALAAALSTTPGSCVIAHICHDIRSPDQTHADQTFVESLAQQLGVAFVHKLVHVAAQPGNLEANARSARYKALEELASNNDCPFIATGHHANDQLETLIMHLMRGSGTRAMGAMLPERQLGIQRLIRPMLEITRAEIESMLREHDISWREDETNDEIQFLRNRIRHELVPTMSSIDPQIASHASAWASDLVAMQSLIDMQVNTQLISIAQRGELSWTWDRDALRTQPDLLLGYLPIRFCSHALRNTGADQITRRAIEAWVRSVKSDSTDPSTHQIGPILSKVSARCVSFTAIDHEQRDTGGTP